MAIDDLLDEHEQSVRVQQWLRRNGGAILLGLLIGLGLLGAWTWYQGHQARQQMANADTFAAASQAIESDSADAVAKVNALKQGPYRTLAQLQLAQQYVTKGKSAEAITLLKSVKVSDPALQDIVNVRLARMLVDTGAAKDAITLLNGHASAASQEVLGDAYAATQQLEQARKAYNAALTQLDSGSPTRQVVELKLTQVGGTPVVTTETQS